ncbi:unnamed protein product [Trichobilharzia szidati]|nr:unnamed protein product [Trichobilharzia szidati]
MNRDTSNSQLPPARKSPEISIVEQLAQNQRTFPKQSSRLSLSSEKRRYSVQNAAGPGGPIGGSSQRVSPRTTPYLSAPNATTGITPPGNHLPRASIACIPLSIQAQIQQGQLVKAEQPQPTLGKGTSVPQTTPRISISKSPELDGENAKKLGRLPKSFRCECCQQVTVTRTTYQIGALTWLMAALIFICGRFSVFSLPNHKNCYENKQRRSGLFSYTILCGLLQRCQTCLPVLWDGNRSSEMYLNLAKRIIIGGKLK